MVFDWIGLDSIRFGWIFNFGSMSVYTYNNDDNVNKDNNNKVSADNVT